MATGKDASELGECTDLLNLAADRARRYVQSIADRRVSPSEAALAALAELSFGEGPISINRHDRQRQATIEADLVVGASLSTASAAVQALPIMKALPPGISVAEAGDAERGRGRSLARGA